MTQSRTAESEFDPIIHTLYSGFTTKADEADFIVDFCSCGIIMCDIKNDPFFPLGK